MYCELNLTKELTFSVKGAFITVIVFGRKVLWGIKENMVECQVKSVYCVHCLLNQDVSLTLKHYNHLFCRSSSSRLISTSLYDDNRRSR